MNEEVRWARVMQISPTLLIRFPGDTGDTAADQNADVTLATTDRVVVLRVGTRWTVAFKV